MLRTLIVGGIVALGGLCAIRGSFPALLFYLWIAYFRPETWVWSDWVSSLNLSLLAGSYLVLRVLVSSQTWWNWRVGLLLAFIVHNAVSLAASEYVAYVTTPFINFLKSVIIAYCITCVTTDLRKFRTVLLVIALSLGAEATKQGWAGMLLEPGGQNNNDIPFLGDNNGVSVGMAMLAPVLLALAATGKTFWERLGFRFMFVGVLYRGLVTYSRGGFLAFGAVVAIYLARSKHRVVAAAAVIIVAVSLLPLLPQHFWDRMSTIAASSEERDKSSTGRLHFWAVAIDMADANPFLGVGPFAYNFAYDQYDPSDAEYGQRRSVHSIWLGVLSELGYVGLFLFITIFAVNWRTIARVRALAKLGTAQVSGEIAHYASALEMSTVAFLVGGTFLPVQQNEMAWHFVGLAISLHRLAPQALAGVHQDA